MRISISPTFRFIIVLLFSTLVLLIKTWVVLTVLFSGAVFLSLVSLSRQKLKERLYPLIIIGVLVILFQIFFNRAIPLEQRVIHGILASGRIITLSMMVFLFTTVTSASEIAGIFSFLPGRYQLMITVCFSFLPVIIDETRKIVTVQAARGQSFKSFNVYRSIIPVVVPLLHRTLQRAQKMVEVMAARGYDI